MFYSLDHAYYKTDNTIIYCEDVLSVLKKLPDESIDCVITSPPYWALRDYQLEPQIWDDGWKGSLGLEPTFELYLKHLLQIFDEIKRVLKKTGTCWVNLGDSYASGTRDIGGIDETRTLRSKEGKHCRGWHEQPNRKLKDYPAKSLCLIPQRFAIGMVDRNWILRNQIIWYKRNCMPSSVKDRFTVDYEPIFFFVKSKRYWFEQQYEAYSPITLTDGRIIRIQAGQKLKHTRWKSYKENKIQEPSEVRDRIMAGIKQGRNRRCVWDITTKPFKGSHFAVFPETLVEPMIKSGCPEFICKKCGKAREKIIKTDYKVRAIRSDKEKHQNIDPAIARPNMPFMGDKLVSELGYTDCGCSAGWTSGIVLDPFAGAGTTGVVAQKLGRKFIGIELNQNYVDKICIPRLEKTREEVRSLF